MNSQVVILSDDQMKRAIEVFVAAFSKSKSRTWPYEITRMQNLWVMRDAERRNQKDYRKEEWIAWKLPAEQVHALAQKETRVR
jgi:hypothetical protein